MPPFYIAHTSKNYPQNNVKFFFASRFVKHPHKIWIYSYHHNANQPILSQRISAAVNTYVFSINVLLIFNQSEKRIDIYFAYYTSISVTE